MARYEDIGKCMSTKRDQIAFSIFMIILLPRYSSTDHVHNLLVFQSGITHFQAILIDYLSTIFITLYLLHIRHRHDGCVLGASSLQETSNGEDQRTHQTQTNPKAKLPSFVSFQKGRAWSWRRWCISLFSRLRSLRSGSLLTILALSGQRQNGRCQCDAW